MARVGLGFKLEFRFLGLGARPAAAGRPRGARAAMALGPAYRPECAAQLCMTPLEGKQTVTVCQ